jgi:DNA (cytosine-5)-methyltransferase 1
MTTSAPSSLSILDLFSGIGGFSYAAEQLVGGFHTVAFCDTDKACHKVLAKHWPATPIFPDIRELTAADIKPLCPNGLSLITAGFPCQDLSVAGKQAGYDGERSVLFYEIIRLARELQPQFLLLENVRNLLSHQNGETFQETLFQIAKAGYDAEWAVIPASDVGACHRRERIWIVAYAQDVFSNGGIRNSEGNLEGARSPNLETVIGRMLPTPTRSDHMDRTYHYPACVGVTRGEKLSWAIGAELGHNEGNTGIPGENRSILNGPPMYLNPSFVEEMMGYPIGWTDLSN